MRFFSEDNVVWRFVRKIGYLWILNILWVATSLPVITIGASTTALIYACMKLQDDEGYPTANYFRSFRENFRQGIREIPLQRSRGPDEKRKAHRDLRAVCLTRRIFERTRTLGLLSMDICMGIG